MKKYLFITVLLLTSKQLIFSQDSTGITMQQKQFGWATWAVMIGLIVLLTIVLVLQEKNKKTKIRFDRKPLNQKLDLTD